MTKSATMKLGLVLLLLLAAALFIYFDLGRFLTLEYIKESQASFQQLYQQHRFSVIAVYMFVYIVVTALSLPGAAVMTLAGGGFFGLVSGTIIVSISSTIGATCACLASRFILRDWVQSKFGDKLSAINSGIEKEGAFYLFSLRLIPIFPFFVINLLMGLTKMPIVTYFWVSQVGMLPATIVYVNAGKELAKIESIAGIASPTLLISFALLGLFPVTVKKVMAFYRRKSVSPGSGE